LLGTIGCVALLSSADAMPRNAWAYQTSPYDDWSYDATPDYGIIHEDYAPSRVLLPKRQHRKSHHSAKSVAPLRKPQRPLIVTISINRQSLKVFDANGLFAETRVSTGMRGHATPMGIFSVIQKNKWHRSNIYSGAPMPYMQRLTWSGIALHAGVVPGYPASHGCIRMPTSFASQMWKWTRMGARVVIVPDEVAPAPIAHPLLATQRPEEQASLGTPDQTSGAATASRTVNNTNATDAKAAVVPVVAELRLSITTDKAERRESANPSKSEKPTLVADAGSAATSSPTTTLADAPSSVAPPQAEPAPAVRRSGPIAVFISGKDNRLYVRQNFEPLFDVAISIAPSDRPLGTHVFTAEQDKQAGSFRWSAISMPARAKTSVATDSASEALDRVSIPPETMTRIAQILTTASSVIVSDQGVNSGETGKGTDFIVPLR
jgi:lipoprotein-anchoring transpeptidase ErfK/SrfK